MVPAGTNISIAFGVLFYGFSIYIKQDAAGAEFSTSVLSAAFGGSMLIAGLIAMPVGRYVDRNGVAKLVGAGSVVAGIGLMAFGQAQEPWQVLAIWWFIIGPAAATVFYEPIFAAINQWFPSDSRPLSLAIVTVVGGSAGIIFIPLVQKVVTTFGWRDATLILGALPIVSGLLITTLVFRNTHRSHKGAATPPKVKLRILLRDRRFTLFTAAMTLGFFSNQAIIAHRLAIFEVTGFDAAVTASWAAAASAFSLPGRWMAPMLAKRFRPTSVQAALLGLTTIGVGLTIRGTTQWEMVGHFAIFGLAFAAFLPLRAMVMSEWFDGPQYGQTMGAQWTIASIVAAAGPTVVGILKDQTGSYRIPMIMVAAVSIVAIGFTLAAGRLDPSSD
jgi:MFS family permease